MSERVARFQVLVYDREKAVGNQWLISPPPGDQNPWITRSRSAPTKEALSSRPWTVELSLQDVLYDSEPIRDLSDKEIAKDYYEFTIIDRTPERKFTILDEVADALSKLKGDLPFEQVFRQAILKYVPDDEQDKYLEAIAGMGFDQATPSASQQYLGNRIRCWNVPDALHGILRATVKDSSRVTTLSESRLIAKVSTDLESHGVITRAQDYEKPSTTPIFMPEVDGLNDLYFHYDLGPMNERAIHGSILDFDPSSLSKSLLDFAETYQLTQPSAVFAKGRINVPYCAWPTPMLTRPRYARLNFRTPEGRLYKWKALPFDLPMASRVWQVFVNHEVNSKLPFVRLVQTTLVICAEDHRRQG